MQAVTSNCDSTDADPRGMRLGIISNPHSGRNRRHINAIVSMLSMHPSARHIVTASSDDIPAALGEFARADINLVGINGGDGSVAQVLTVLHDQSPFATAPVLCALPGGTTNVTVNDVGIRGGLQHAVLTLLAFMRHGNRHAQILQRPIIRVSSRTGATLGCGLVFGTGAVVDGIEYWQQQVQARGMRSEFSSGVAMTRTLWGMLRGHDGFAKPLPMRIRHAGAHPTLDGAFMLLVISALQRLFLGIHPFWGENQGALYFTAIEHGAAGFARALPGILRGRPGARVNTRNGYHSCTLDSVELEFSGSYTLDGELHRVLAEDAPVTVARAGTARFLRV